MSRNVLIIAAIAGAEHCGRSIAEQLGIDVEVATSRRAGLQALRAGIYGVVVVEESLAESDPVWADLIWKNTGLAMPVAGELRHFGQRAACTRGKGCTRTARRGARHCTARGRGGA